MITGKILVLGVGNPLRQDDGIGIEVIKRLAEKKISKFDLVDGGTDGLALLDIIKQYRQAIIIDAVNMDMPAGTVKQFTPQEATLKIKYDALSTHGFGLAEVIKFMEQLDIKTDIRIIGVQPRSINFGDGLSEEVSKQIPEILTCVMQYQQN